MAEDPPLKAPSSLPGGDSCLLREQISKTAQRIAIEARNLDAIDEESFIKQAVDGELSKLFSAEPWSRQFELETTPNPYLSSQVEGRCSSNSCALSSPSHVGNEEDLTVTQAALSSSQTQSSKSSRRRNKKKFCYDLKNPAKTYA